MQPATVMSAGFLLSMRIDSHTPRSRGRRWTRLREQVLRAEPRCLACLKAGRLTVATEVDHILPLHRGGGDASDNLQPLCHDCHADKSAAERGARRRAATGPDGWPLTGVG